MEIPLLLSADYTPGLAFVITVALAFACDAQAPYSQTSLSAPFTRDVHTIDLQHLDQTPGAETGQNKRRPDDDPFAAMQKLLPTGEAELAGLTDTDKPPDIGQPTPPRLRGDCRIEPDAGRFAGGLRLGGTDGALVMTWGIGNPHDNRDRTIELWIRPDGLPKSSVTLFDLHFHGGGLPQHLAQMKPNPVRMVLDPDGTIRFGNPGAEYIQAPRAVRPG